MIQQFHLWVYTQRKGSQYPLSWRDICTPMFTAAIFTIVKIWKQQPNYPSTEEWIKNMLRACSVQLFVTSWTVAYQDPLSMRFSRQEILEWVVIFFSRGSFQHRDLTHIPCMGRQILYHWATWEACKENVWFVHTHTHTHTQGPWWPRGLGKGGVGGRLEREGLMYTCGWFMLLYSRNQHNIVKHPPVKHKFEKKKWIY